jgi:adenosylhomocysteine nucleosidase
MLFQKSLLIPTKYLASMARIVILAAMPEEIKSYDKEIKNGRWHGHEVFVTLTGVGKVLAAATTQKMILEKKPDYILFTGLAGALSSDAGLGDIAVVEYAIDAELDCTRWMGHLQLGEQPFSGERIFHSNPKLVKIALDGRAKYRVYPSYIATTSVFMDNPYKLKFIRDTAQKLKIDQRVPDAIDMETSAVLQVAAKNKVPCLVIRAISDTVKGDAPADFKAFCETEIDHYIEIVRHVLGRI